MLESCDLRAAWQKKLCKYSYFYGIYYYISSTGCLFDIFLAVVFTSVAAKLAVISTLESASKQLTYRGSKDGSGVLRLTPEKARENGEAADSHWMVVVT